MLVGTWGARVRWGRRVSPGCLRFREGGSLAAQKPVLAFSLGNCVKQTGPDLVIGIFAFGGGEEKGYPETRGLRVPFVSPHR